MNRNHSEPGYWSPVEEDRVRLALGKAAAQGAQGFSAMLGSTVTPDTWGLLRVPFNELPVGLFTPQQSVYGVFMQIQGDLYGTAALCFSVPSTEKLMDKVLAQMGVTPRGNTDELMRSAMEEGGNIFVNGFMTGLSRALKMELYPSVPKLEQGPWEKTWSKLAVAQGTSGDKVILFCDFSWSLTPKFGQFFLALSKDSLENLRLWALRGKAMALSVGIGVMEVAESPMVLKATDLGSCVAVVLYDPQRKVGGMAHVMLPQSPSPEFGMAKPGKYADTAVTALVKGMRAKTKLSAWLVGGAEMLMAGGSILSGSIGARNIEALRKELKKAGIRLTGEDVGGTQARSVELVTETGELWIKWGQMSRKEFIR